MSTSVRKLGARNGARKKSKNCGGMMSYSVRKNGARKKSKRTVVPYLSASHDKVSNAIGLHLSMGDDDNVPNDPQQANAALPEDIIELIVTRLPLIARCRCRCVCQKWNRDLLALQLRTSAIQLAPSMVLCKKSSGDAKVFCHSTEQWMPLLPQSFPLPLASDLHPSPGISWETHDFRAGNPPSIVVENIFTIPSDVIQSTGPVWELVDVDGGLLCYQSLMEGRYWFCVSSPITSFCQVIPPDYYHRRGDEWRVVRVPVVKLLVDQGKKTFKLVLVLDQPSVTAVHDSTTSSWLIYSHPYPNMRFHMKKAMMFAWKNVVYARGPEGGWSYSSRQVTRAFNMESGAWTTISLTNYPGAESHQGLHEYIILSGKDQLILVQYPSTYSGRWYGGRCLFYVWKLVDDDSSAPSSFSRWEKIICGTIKRIEEQIGQSLSGYGLRGACLGPDCMCFQLQSEYCRGRQNDESDYMILCVKYSFASRKWSLLLGSPDRERPYRLFNWEPRVNMHPIEKGVTGYLIGSLW